MTWTRLTTLGHRSTYRHTGSTDDFCAALANSNTPAEPDRVSAGVAYSVQSLRAGHQLRVGIRSSLDGRQNIQAGIVDHVFLAALGVTVAAGLYGVALRKDSSTLATFSYASAYTLLARSTSNLVVTGALASNEDNNVNIELRTANGRLSLYVNGVTCLTAAATGDYLLTDSDFPHLPCFGFVSHINDAVAKFPSRAALIAQRRTTVQVASIVSGGELFVSENNRRPQTKGVVADPTNDVDADYLDGRIFYVDGKNFYYFDYADGSVNKMAPDNGHDYWTVDDANPDNITGAPIGAETDPADTVNRRRTGSTTATVITAHGKRLYLAAELQIQATAVAAPFDFNAGSLIDGRSFVYDSENLSSVIRSPVVCMEPYNEDYMLVGCVSEVHLLRGDPIFDDATITNVTRAVGVCGKDAAEVGENGAILIVTEQGLDKVVSGAYVPVSSAVLDSGISLGADWVLRKPKLVRDTVRRGLAIFYPAVDHDEAEEHFWWDETSGGAFPERYGDDVNITAAGRVNGEILVGTSHGYVYVYEDSADGVDEMSDDDGGDTPIESFCPIGLIMDTDGRECTMTTRCVINLSRDSGTVLLEWFVGRTPEDAYLIGTALDSFEVGAGRSELSVRVCGGAIVPVISTDEDNTAGWSIEYLHVETLMGGLIPDLPEPSEADEESATGGFGDGGGGSGGGGDGPIGGGGGGGGDITGPPFPVLHEIIDDEGGFRIPTFPMGGGNDGSPETPWSDPITPNGPHDGSFGAGDVGWGDPGGGGGGIDPGGDPGWNPPGGGILVVIN